MRVIAIWREYQRSSILILKFNLRKTHKSRELLACRYSFRLIQPVQQDMEMLFKLAFKLTAGFLGGWGNPGLWIDCLRGRCVTCFSRKALWWLAVAWLLEICDNTLEVSFFAWLQALKVSAITECWWVLCPARVMLWALCSAIKRWRKSQRLSERASKQAT